MKTTKKLAGGILIISLLGLLSSLAIAQDPVDPLPEDINNDGVVDIRDLVLVANAIGQTVDDSAEQNPDATGDGVVNVLDLVRVASRFGATAMPTFAVRKLYWGDVGTNLIQRADPDGSNVETVFSDVAPWDLELDVENGKIYWLSWRNRRLCRGNLNGTGFEVLATGFTGEELELDLRAGKIYWSGSGKLERSNLDGSDREVIISDSPKPDGIALDLDAGKLYFTDTYWEFTNPLAGTIQKSNLDGTDREVLVRDLKHPQGLNLDLRNGKMYWTHWHSGTGLYRANIDGSNVEQIVPGYTGLAGTSIDFVNNKIYWTDFGSDKILRANLDGSEVEEVITEGLREPLVIVLDIAPVN